MDGTIFRSIFNCALAFTKINAISLRTVHTAPIAYAARKGTRAKARAKKVKVEITKVGFIPHNQRGKKDATKHINKHLGDSYKKVAIDDVYPMKYYRSVVYSVQDAVRAHQETHHPTMFNMPDAFIYAQVELNMQAVKKNRYLDSFTRLTLLPNQFPRDEERTILAFVKTPELISEARDAGATLAGAGEIVKKIQEGQIKLNEYEYVIAHPNMITDLVPIRGLMKKKFPNVRSGTLHVDIAGLVKKFATGIQYKAVKDEHQQDFACIEIPVGTLNMEPKQIDENIDTFLKDIQSARPKRDGLFVTRCYLLSPPSTEKLKIDPFVYVNQTLSKEVQDDSDDEDELVAAATA